MFGSQIATLHLAQNMQILEVTKCMCLSRQCFLGGGFEVSPAPVSAYVLFGLNSSLRLFINSILPEVFQHALTLPVLPWGQRTAARGTRVNRGCLHRRSRTFGRAPLWRRAAQGAVQGKHHGNTTKQPSNHTESNQLIVICYEIFMEDTR